MTATTTIRVALNDRNAAHELAKQTGLSLMEVVHEAIELYRRQYLLGEMNRGFAALRRDSAAWNKEMAERQGWDITLGDAPGTK
ncbi:MAG: toxin-antitoxin system protein [Gemmatimonadaceae bacterium]